jgi:hypothetical protein
MLAEVILPVEGTLLNCLLLAGGEIVLLKMVDAGVESSAERADLISSYHNNPSIR